MIRRGHIYWVDLGETEGSKPAGERPVVIVSSDAYNASRLATVLAAVVTGNTDLAAMPGNVFLPRAASGLPRDSVINVTALITINKDECRAVAAIVPAHLMLEVDRGLREVLGL